MNLSAQEYLAKLLAKENLSVQHGNYSTASFDVMNRVLRLPLWEDKGKDVYDLLVGHEVGHALYTPADGWHDSEKKIGKIPRAYLNIVEDIRIERMIQETYPGIVRRFKNGYKRLFDDNLFGTDDRDINKSGLMDRLNVSSKGRGYVPVEFSDEETPLVKEAMEVKTWDDVLKICQKLYDWIDENEEDEELPEGTGADFPSNDMDGDDDAETENPQGTTPPENDEEMEEESEGNEGGEADSEGDETPVESKKQSKHSPWTEENFRENEKDLLETKEDRNGEERQSAYSAGISEVNLEKIVYTYKEAKAFRDGWVEEHDSYDREGCAYENEKCKEDWEKSKGALNSTANLLAKDFERKKAAFEYSRATSSKTGTLDPLKLHAYKYTEDIFLTTTQLAQAKSHGIMMFVDFSGSMCDIIEDVVSQAITIAMFCRKVNIPFEVYSFTTTGWHGRDLQEDIKVKGNELDDLTKVKVVEIFSSKMNKKTFEEASQLIFALSKAHSYRRDSTYYIPSGQLHMIDTMGSTPLIQTTILAAKLTKAFQKKNAIQKTNIMMLTDGYPDSVGINDDKEANVKTDRSHKTINFNGKLIKGGNARELYTQALEVLRELTGAKILGFHLAENASTFGQGYWDIVESKDFKDVIKKWRKEGHSVWKNQKGYDDYFIIKVGQKHVDEEFDPKKTETIRDIRNEFKKFNKTKKHTKQLVARITDAVAV